MNDISGVNPKEVQSLIGAVYVKYRGDRYQVKGGRTYRSRTVFLPLETDDGIDRDAVVRFNDLSSPGQTAVDAVASGRKSSAAVDSGNLNLPHDATAVSDQGSDDGPDVRIADGSEWTYTITVS